MHWWIFTKSLSVLLFGTKIVFLGIIFKLIHSSLLIQLLWLWFMVVKWYSSS